MLKASEPWKASDAVPREKWVKYQDVVEDLGRRSGEYKPELRAIDVMMSEEELAQAAGIGKAKTMDQNQLPFPLLATHVKELAEEGKRDPLARLSLQVGVEGKVLQDEAGNVYVYRVTGAEKAHEPKSLDEVRGKVVEDLKKLANYERVTKEAAALAEGAKGGDLMAAAAAKKVPATKSVEFSQTGELPQEIQNIRGLVKGAFSLVPAGAKAGPETAAGTQAASQPAGPGVGNTTVVNDDSALRSYAVQLLSVRPASAAAFGEQLQAELRRTAPSPTLMRAAHQEAAVAFAGYLGLEELMKRLKYVPDTALPPARKD
jgi:hypothetical protein